MNYALEKTMNILNYSVVCITKSKLLLIADVLNDHDPPK